MTRRVSCVHLHEEQFDDWNHAACGVTDLPRDNPRILQDEAFQETPRSQRCRNCARKYWPYGGEPLQ